MKDGGRPAESGKGRAENPRARLILEAALKLFCEKGYDTASTDEIAAGAAGGG